VTDATIDVEMTGEFEVAAEAMGIVISGGDRGDEPARFAAYEWFLPDEDAAEAA
jgi:hypothetical protein